MPTIEDRRTPAEKTSHPVIILATDKFLSGWGHASNGASYAGWACRPEHAPRVERWVRARREMIRVREVGPGYRPGPHCAHLSIYVVNDGHPALV
jgi:hypothetical protein